MAQIPGYPVPRKLWVETGEKCATCSKKFTLFTNKSNCPFCGKLCCAHCIAAECAILPGSQPSKVCVNCFSMIQDHRRGMPDQGKGAAGGRIEHTPATHSGMLNNDHEPDQSQAVTSSSCYNTIDVFDGTTENSLTVDHINKLLKKSENLRLENVDWLNRSKHYESEISSLREMLNDIKAELLAKQSIIDHHIATQSVKDNQPHSLIHELNKVNQSLLFLKENKEREALESQAAFDFAFKLQAEFQSYKSESPPHDDQFRTEANAVDVHEVLQKNEMLQKDMRKLKARLSTSNAEVAALHAAMSSRPASVPPGAPAGLRELPPSLVPEADLTPVEPVPEHARDAGTGVREWGFDSFDAAARLPSLLQAVAGTVAAQWKLFPAGSEAAQRWARLVAVVEKNYAPNPYHNATHAADVLQGLFALVSAAGPVLTDRLTLVERRAAAFAAIAHDLRHPARTNAFLAAVGDPVCVRYAWRGALEQMHNAAAFEILAVPELDFTLGEMDTAAFLEFKNIVTSLIARTDMSVHMECLARWGARAAGRDLGFDMARPADRVEALALLLHAADIGAPARGVAVALKWLVVLDEFDEQAADERRRGLPVTPGFDRTTPVEKAQLGFLDAFVIPTFDVLHQLFPAVVEPLRNLRALREHYAAAAGISTPFPPTKDYTDPSARVRELETFVAECRRRDTVARQCLSDMRSASTALRERTDVLQTHERASAEREEVLNAREHQLATMSERLAAVAESIEEVKRRCQLLDLREATVRSAELVSERESFARREVEGRLAVRNAEVEELLVIVGEVRAHSAGHWRELKARAAGRDAAVPPLAGFLRKRRSEIAQSEMQSHGEAPEEANRLESAVMRLNAAIAQLADEDARV